jgi:YD repeat-containing protein
VTFVQHDRFGRKTQEGTTGGKIVTYTHDTAGRVTREQSLGVDNRYTYGIFGVTSIRNIEGNTSHSNYDGMGRLVRSSDFMGNFTNFTYDTLGRLIRKDVPFERVGNITHNASTRHFYDRNGNVTYISTLTNRPGQPQEWTGTRNSYRHDRLISSIIGGCSGTTGGITTSYT